MTTSVAHLFECLVGWPKEARHSNENSGILTEMGMHFLATMARNCSFLLLLASNTIGDHNVANLLKREILNFESLQFQLFFNT